MAKALSALITAQTHAPMFGDFGSKPKALCLGLYLH